MSIGSCWASGSWISPSWLTGSWADAVTPAVTGISLEFHCWGSLIEGVIGFPYLLDKICIGQLQYKAVDRGMTEKQVIQIDKNGYAMVDAGARVFYVYEVEENMYKIVEGGTREIDLIQTVAEQVYITSKENILEI